MEAKFKHVLLKLDGRFHHDNSPILSITNTNTTDSVDFVWHDNEINKESHLYDAFYSFLEKEMQYGLTDINEVLTNKENPAKFLSELHDFIFWNAHHSE